MLESRFFVPMGVLAEGVTFGVVHCGDIGHVLIIEFKSGQVEVLTLALRVQGLRDGHVAVLEVQRKMAWTTEIPCLAAIRFRSGSRSIWLARPSGLHASVMMPCALS